MSTAVDGGWAAYGELLFDTLDGAMRSSRSMSWPALLLSDGGNGVCCCCMLIGWECDGVMDRAGFGVVDGVGVEGWWTGGGVGVGGTGER